MAALYVSRVKILTVVWRLWVCDWIKAYSYKNKSADCIVGQEWGPEYDHGSVDKYIETWINVRITGYTESDWSNLDALMGVKRQIFSTLKALFG